MTVVAGVSNGELAVILNPGCYLVSAVGIGEELNLDILQALVVGQTCADGVIEIVGGQAGCVGGNGRQSGQNLILHNITGRSGSIVLKAVVNIGGAVIVAGVLQSLTDSFLQCGNACLIFGVHDDIVIPEVAALRRSRLNITGNSSHGQGYEEGVGSAGNHLGNNIFDRQVQANTQITLNGLTIVVSQRHVNSVGVCCHVSFQCVLDSGGILSQCGGHSLVQDIRLIEPAICIQVVSVLVTVLTVSQADRCQQILGFNLIESVQQLGQVVIGMLIIFRLRESNRGCHIGDGEANTLDGITVTGLAVAQGMVGRVVVIALADTAAQDMSQGLGPFAQFIEGHCLGSLNTDDRAIVQADFLDFLLPGQNFLCAVGLLREVNDLPGVECQSGLSTAQTVIDSLAALSKALKNKTSGCARAAPPQITKEKNKMKIQCHNRQPQSTAAFI